MRFTTPCFVRVENPQERKDLQEWLKSIGRERVPHSKTDRAPWFTAYLTGRYEQNNGFCTHPNNARYNGYIDCGTDIPLFKALAAMNDENDREQWFYCHTGSGEDFYSEHLFHYDEVCTLCSAAEQEVYFRKAASNEIINHFKNQKS